MSTPRLVLLMLIVNIAVVLGGVFVNYKMIKSASLAPAAAASDKEAAKEDATEEEQESAEYLFVPVEKIIVSSRGEDREHYFVIDLVLQARAEQERKKLESVAPMVRSSVVANLTPEKFEVLRAMPIGEVQTRLEKAVIDDFAARKVVVPFEHVLLSKMIVQ
ncbi:MULTISPECIES: flagellar basal body-associated FliL family protein [Pseudomonas]|uniref:Flagellar protein FliL n=1 Tax=Pseudomonas nitroreducens TaxID=46680 RepID=A0A6G6IRZ6_PSENT|nr:MULTISPECIES: flagellar basal body-associated FliL family protein [Pseudomonas]MBG6287571.1 flagellar basal body-associated FliL family protein [Pseudomonas nitroreducens]MCE4068083.1 flagellar basal body-associated FliL family protein [Pseudomonas nitritireducens]MCE4077272.1 flagellar basal body-associated FliL family protein [Pseudomonas nitroreducens]MCJ1878910.1 flagellar basal body-associated FliL family protein [Pseudomonas nitroreducens]MCJ1896276.1 flagellar basal body-associated F